MFEEKLKEVAEHFGGSYQHHDQKYRGQEFSSLPVSDHRLIIPYEGVEIIARFNFGTSNVGYLQTTFQPRRNFSNFELNRTSHFLMLFQRKKSPWKIKCEDANLKQRIKDFLIDTGLNDMADATAFQPIISGDNVDDQFVLDMKYNLAFENKENSFLPVTHFFVKIVTFMS